MNITQRLQDLDPTLVLHNEGHWDLPLDPNAPGYTSFNDAGIETETGEFLYGLARILKPDHILETGTHIGVGAAYLGTALKDNKKGHLDTIEFLADIHKQAKQRVSSLDLNDQVTCHFGDAAGFVPSEGVKYQLILLDTEPQTRFAEAVRFCDRLDEGGFMFIHDLHRHMGQHNNEEHGFGWPFGKLPKALVDLVRAGKLKPIHFATPRGLTGFYKPHSGDYDWNLSDNDKNAKQK